MCSTVHGMFPLQLATSFHPDLRVTLYRKHVGVDATTIVASAVHLDQNNFDAAKEEWENLELSEGEE
jgi:hypothetical protein